MDKTVESEIAKVEDHETDLVFEQQGDGTLMLSSDQSLAFSRTMTVEEAVKDYKEVIRFVKTLMSADVHYGRIPGTPKPTLFQPGAEFLLKFFKYPFYPIVLDKVEQWDVPVTETTFPIFYYQVAAVATQDGRELYRGIGSANSMEERYRYRWLPENALPSNIQVKDLPWKMDTVSEFQFALEKKETEGKYGKPESYWAEWDEAIASGEAKQIKRKTKAGKEMDAWERGGKLYQVQNTNIYNEVNTILKMAQKRAVVELALFACSAHEFFTQDIEDKERKLEEKLSPLAFVPSVQAAKQELLRIGGEMNLNGNDIKSALVEANMQTFDLNRWSDMVIAVQEYAAKRM